MDLNMCSSERLSAPSLMHGYSLCQIHVWHVWPGHRVFRDSPGRPPSTQASPPHLPLARSLAIARLWAMPCAPHDPRDLGDGLVHVNLKVRTTEAMGPGVQTCAGFPSRHLLRLPRPSPIHSILPTPITSPLLASRRLSSCPGTLVATVGALARGARRPLKSLLQRPEERILHPSWQGQTW
jgi:hypothetical protein